MADETVHEQLEELVETVGDRLVGVNDLARLVGLSDARAAQLRAERRRQDGFPPVARRDGGRTQLHRLDQLLRWVLDHEPYRSELRLGRMGAAQYQLEDLAAALATAHGAEPVRRVLVGLALVRADPGAQGLFNGDTVSIDGLVAYVRSRPQPRTDQRSGVQLIDDPEAFELLVEGAESPAGVGHLPTSDLAQLATGVHRLAEAAGDMDGGTGTGQAATEATRRFLLAVDEVIERVADEHASTPHRAVTALGVLLAVVLDARAGDKVAEPTAGECESLIIIDEVVRAMGDAGICVVPGDRVTSAALIGRARLDAHGVEVLSGWSRYRFDPLGVDGVNRVIVDPGRVDKAELTVWFRRVTEVLDRNEHSRAVLVVPRDALTEAHIHDLPPAAVFVLPTGVAVGASEPVLLWVCNGTTGTTPTCTVVDLRHRSPAMTDVATWVQLLARAARCPDADRLEIPASHGEALGSVLAGFGPGGVAIMSSQDAPPAPGSVSIPDEVEISRLWSWTQGLDRLRPSRGDTARVVANNARYALWLALELERLIDTTAPNEAAWTQVGTDRPDSRRRPIDSPDGVLVDEVPEEARRAVRRLVDRLSNAPRAKRGRPAKR